VRRSCLALIALLCVARPAAATYSIVGADQASQQVGGAGTSCVGGSDVYIIYGSVPGFGVVHAQATVNEDGRDRAVELIELGTAPDAILDEITGFAFDPSSANRQYGIADVMGRTAGFTGNGTRTYADDIQGSVGSFHYSVQGNILTSAAVLTQASSAFEGSGCDLADRLMLALEAGAENGEGDSRCTDDGIPSDSAFLQVELPDEPAGDYLSLRVPTSGNDNPLIELRADYDAWRSTHPCPVMMPDGGAAGMGGTSGGASGAGGASSGGSASGASSGGSAGSGTSAGGSAAAGTSGSGGSSAPDAGVGPMTAEPATEEAGCACRTQSPAGSGGAELGALLVAGAIVLARRRARSA
jgi:MYXO-CTERM domain-containing protein